MRETAIRNSRAKKKGRLSRKTNSILANLAVIVGVVIVLTGGLVGFMFFNDRMPGGELGIMPSIPAIAASRETIFENISINGVDVGGLTYEQALERLSAGHVVSANKQLTVVAVQADETLVVNFSDLNPGFDFSDAVSQAMAYGTDESDRAVRDRLSATPLRITQAPVYSYDDAMLTAKIEEFLHSLEREPKNATSERSEGQFTVTEEIVGLSADIPATIALARTVVAANESGTIEAVFRYIEPSVTAEGLRNAQSLLGTFSTTVTGSLELPRNLNVINAARHINDVVVAPGEVFSTNHYFGAMTRANGYHYAPIIVDGEFVPGIGGGICQVSSTLYMALLFAEMEIVERRNHSLRVTYIDWAMDATLATNLIDLRWRNNTDHPVYVESVVTSAGEVIVNIFGYESRPEGRTLRFVPVHLGSTAPSETIIPDPDRPYGQRYVERRGVTGQQYALYKHVYQNNERVNRYRVNTSNYRVVNAVVRVGTYGAPADSADEAPTDVPPVAQPETPPDTPPAETGNNQEPAPPTTGDTTPPVETPPVTPDPPPADNEIVDLPDLSGWLTQPTGPPTY